MRLLVVEDDVDLQSQVVNRLQGAGFLVEAAGDGEQGRYYALEYPLDLAVIDLGLPGLSGLEVIRAARAAGRDYPILILTARDRWQDKVEGLEAGADDYLVKPFHPEELLARVRALLRRSGGWAQPVQRLGPLSVDTSAQRVSLDGAEVELTAFEYRLLEYLVLHAGEVVSKSVLVEHLYPDDGDPDSNVIEVLIRRLRRKLDPEGAIAPIDTLRGRGYRLNLPRGSGE